MGEYFDIMQREHLLDLDNRKGKAPGGYCTDFPATERPFIFMNAVGLHDDVQTLLHEGGHAFHDFEINKLPLYQRSGAPIEFAEVASMSMEHIAGRYLPKSEGGFYTEADAARARVEHLESDILFWPYMAVVDAFQQWVYTHPEAALNAANCDAVWGEQWDRFMGGVDYSGFDDVKVTGWHRKLHIFQIPFYYVDYGIAQLGAVQVWRNSLSDQAKAVADYRHALGARRHQAAAGIVRRRRCQVLHGRRHPPQRRRTDRSHLRPTRPRLIQNLAARSSPSPCNGEGVRGRL